MTRLTIKRLEAIQEALLSRLAGEIDVQDDDAPTHDDYDRAADWVTEQISKRENKRVTGPTGLRGIKLFSS